MFNTLNDETYFADLHGKPISSIYNFDTGLVCEDDRQNRRLLNASVRRAAYTFDHATKAQLRKRLV